MCGRFTSSQRREAIAERFQVAVPDTYSERYNLGPTQRALVIRNQDEDYEAALVRWRLLPHWAKGERISYKLINARAETLTEKPALRSLLGKYRCLVVADGFHEWRIGADGPSSKAPGSTRNSPASTRSSSSSRLTRFR